VAVCRTYSKAERDLGRFSGRVDGVISRLGKPICFFFEKGGSVRRRGLVWNVGYEGVLGRVTAFSVEKPRPV